MSSNYRQNVPYCFFLFPLLLVCFVLDSFLFSRMRLGLSGGTYILPIWCSKSRAFVRHVKNLVGRLFASKRFLAPHMRKYGSRFPNSRNFRKTLGGVGRIFRLSESIHFRY